MLISSQHLFSAVSPSIQRPRRFLLVVIAAACLTGPEPGDGRLNAAKTPALDQRETFRAPGAEWLVFNNWYDGAFSDAKIAGVELIHHGERTVTNGDVRLSATPGQWDPVPELRGRRVDRGTGEIVVELSYPAYGFDYVLRASAAERGLRLRVELSEPLPVALVDRAGFNLEFLPATYAGRGIMADDDSGRLPVYATGPHRRRTEAGDTRKPLASGRHLVLAPASEKHRVGVRSRSGELMLHDGRTQAQNGWLVIRELLPEGRTGVVVEWILEASAIEDWVRAPMIGFSQVGYAAGQPKTAILECDPAGGEPGLVTLWRVGHDGSLEKAMQRMPEHWGTYLRYEYYRFDFSRITDPGLYLLEAAGQRTSTFRISDQVYADTWQPTLDVFFPVQMDHVLVNEAYRVWHGESHRDDARQAPVNHEHFDLYAQGPTTDTPYQPGEHIPGLNVGGWYDAGDYDIRTQTQYSVVLNLVHLWELFRPERDETSVDYVMRRVDLWTPDGVPDVLQQIEHGTLALIAQHRAVGHAIPGIIAPTLEQYTHLGDGATKTDNLIYRAGMAPHERDGVFSGLADDRWAFTTHTSALNYGSAAALAAASRALAELRPALAEDCLATAIRVWDREHAEQPATFRHGNTTGGWLPGEELNAAIELLRSTGDTRYRERIDSLWPELQERRGFYLVPLLKVQELLSPRLQDALHDAALEQRAFTTRWIEDNPYGVPISTGGWAGNGRVVRAGISAYHLHRAFPEQFSADGVWRALNYLYGCHPDSNLSFVSGVGAQSKQVAYGGNRADFSYIAGGVVPGVLILKPDYPENKEDWPFLWGENEYVINLAASYLYLVHAANDLLAHP